MSIPAPTERRPSRVRLAVAFVALYVIWGSTYLGIRIAVETLPPFLMAGSRFLLAGTTLYVWARLRSREKPLPRHWASAAVVGGLLLFGGNGAVSWSERVVPSGLASLIVAALPIWMVAIEALRPGGVRPTPRTVVGLLLGLVGLGILVGPGLSGAAAAPLLPVAVLTLGSLCWAVGSLYSRSAKLPRTQLLGIGMEMLAGGALLVVAGLLVGEWRVLDVRHVSVRSVAAVFYLALFGSIVAYTAYIWLLQVTTPASVSTYAYVNPVVAVFLGWAFAGEPVTARMLVAAAIIVGSVVIVTTRGRAERPAGEPTALEDSLAPG